MAFLPIAIEFSTQWWMDIFVDFVFMIDLLTNFFLPVYSEDDS